MLPPYTKPHLSFDDQLALLIQRGLAVSDEPRAIEHLKRIGYGRLALYWQPFQPMVPDPVNDGIWTRSTTFLEGSEFKHAVDLYLFDKQLRLLFMDALERVEVALRVDLAHVLGKRDPWAYLDPNFLDRTRANQPAKRSASQPTRHEAWLDKAEHDIDRCKEDWVTEFLDTYSSGLPIWMAVETWDFGTLSWLLDMAHLKDRFEIAQRYGLLPNTLVSWIRTLAFVRNICAHHARLWNAPMVNQPSIPQASESVQLRHLAVEVKRQNRVYGATAIASHFVKKINPSSSWSERMKSHWQHFPPMPHATLAHSGFFDGWDQEAIWG